MTTKQLSDLLDYIQENNSWEHMYELHEQDRYCYKYVYIAYDTRDTDEDKDPHIWSVTLSNSGMKKIFDEQNCTYDNIKKFLDLPIDKVLKQFEKENK